MIKSRRGKRYRRVRRARSRRKIYETIPVALWVHDYPIFCLEAVRENKIGSKPARFINFIFTAARIYSERFPGQPPLSPSAILAIHEPETRDETDKMLDELSYRANRMIKDGLDITDIRQQCIDLKQVIILRDSFEY